MGTGSMSLRASPSGSRRTRFWPSHSSVGRPWRGLLTPVSFQLGHTNPAKEQGYGSPKGLQIFALVHSFFDAFIGRRIGSQNRHFAVPIQKPGKPYSESDGGRKTEGKKLKAISEERG